MAVTQIHFTKKKIDSLSIPGEKYQDYKDDENRYLRLRISSSGTMTFFYTRKYKGRVKWIKLGNYPDITPKQARNKAATEAAKFASGEDPTKPKSDKMTFGELFNKYMKNYSQRFKKTWQEDQRLHDTLFSSLDNKRLNEIDRTRITSLHKKITRNNGAYAANRVVELIRKVFNYAIDSLELEIRNPAIRIKKNKERSRERFLNETELQRFFQALDNEKTPEQWRDFFYLTLFTGARRGNLQAMRWKHLDLENGVWEIPGTEFKNGEPFSCILTSPAVEILKRRRQQVDSKFVFPAKSKSGHIVETRKAWANILEKAELEGVRLHDLRRTLGSWQAAAGTSLQIIAKSLGHRNQKTTEIYSRLDLDPVRQSVNAAAANMLQAKNNNTDK